MSSRTAITVNRPRDEVEHLWRSAEHRPAYVDDADAAVTFKKAPGDRGTEIHVDLEGSTPGGKLGEVVQKLSRLRAAGEGQGGPAALQAARRDGRRTALGRVAGGRAGGAQAQAALCPAVGGLRAREGGCGDEGERLVVLSDPTGRGDYKADVAAVREGNMEDPHRKIHDGQPAVTPATA